MTKMNNWYKRATKSKILIISIALLCILYILIFRGKDFGNSISLLYIFLVAGVLNILKLYKTYREKNL